MFLSWRAKRKFIASLILFGGLALVLGILIYRSLPEPTCFDNKQNQGEEKVDCGGPCQPCVKSPKDMVILWTRVFEIKEGVYDVASLIENPNLFYGLPVFKYVFKLYDADSILVAEREGQSFLNPRDKFVILETNISTAERRPVRAFVEIEFLSSWQYVSKERPSLIISEKNFYNTAPSRFEARVFNQSLFALNDIYAAAVLYDENGNAVAVSSTKIDILQGEEGRKIIFTWPFSFEKEPASSEIFLRTNP